MSDPKIEYQKLLRTVERISSCEDPSTILYDPNALLSLAEPAADIKEDYSTIIARRVARIVRRLDALSDESTLARLTPRSLLEGLTEVFREACWDSLAPSMKQHLSDRESKESLLSLYTSARRIPIECMVETLYALSYVSVKLRIELVFSLLRRKLTQEASQRHVGDQALAALHSTRTLLDDIEEVFNNVLLLVPSLTRERFLSPSAITEASDLDPLYTSLTRYYYQMTDWCLLSINSADATDISYTRVTSVVCDGKKGIIDVHMQRPSVDGAWGLLFNEKAKLIDVDIPLRVHEKGETLHQLLQCSKEGATLLRMNGTPIETRSSQVPDVKKILNTVRESSEGYKRIHFQLKSEGFKDNKRQRPFELAFVVPPQGAEGAAGQQASLWLQRQDARVDWSLPFADGCLPDGSPVLQFLPQGAVLKFISPSAKQFLKEYQRRLRVWSINGIEVHQTAQAMSLLEGKECARIDIVVMPPAPYTGTDRSVEGEAAEEGGWVRTEDVTSIEAQVRRATRRQAHKVAETEAVSLPVEPKVGKGKRKRVKSSTTPSSASEAEIDRMVAAVAKEYEVDMETALSEHPDTIQEEEEAAAEVSEDAVEAILAEMTTKATSPTPSNDTDRCRFSNGVELTYCTLNEMRWQRPNPSIPWSLRIKVVDTEAVTSLCLTELPDTKGNDQHLRQHPYVQLFYSQPTEHWTLHSVNGKEVAGRMKETLKNITTLKKMKLIFRK